MEQAEKREGGASNGDPTDAAEKRERQHRELSKNSHHLAKRQHWKISLVQLLLNQQSLSPNVR